MNYYKECHNVFAMYITNRKMIRMGNALPTIHPQLLPSATRAVPNDELIIANVIKRFIGQYALLFLVI